MKSIEGNEIRERKEIKVSNGSKVDTPSKELQESDVVQELTDDWNDKERNEYQKNREVYSANPVTEVKERISAKQSFSAKEIFRGLRSRKYTRNRIYESCVERIIAVRLIGSEFAKCNISGVPLEGEMRSGGDDSAAEKTRSGLLSKQDRNRD